MDQNSVVEVGGKVFKFIAVSYSYLFQMIYLLFKGVWYIYDVGKWIYYGIFPPHRRNES